MELRNKILEALYIGTLIFYLENINCWMQFQQVNTTIVQLVLFAWCHPLK